MPRMCRAVALAALIPAACASGPDRTSSGIAPQAGETSAASATAGLDPGIELPPGEGRAVLVSKCLGCHDLGGLAAYDGYYDAERWRGLILTMVDHGATLREAEIALLTDYLVEHFGPADSDTSRPEGE